MFHEKGNYDSLMGEIEHPAVKKKTDASASGASSAAAPVAVEAAVRPSAADPSVERWKKKTAKKELPSLKKPKKHAEPAVEITVDDARKAVLTGLIEANTLTVADCQCMLVVTQAAAKAEKAKAKAAKKAEKEAAKAAAKQETDAAKAAAKEEKEAAKAAAKEEKEAAKAAAKAEDAAAKAAAAEAEAAAAAKAEAAAAEEKEAAAEPPAEATAKPEPAAEPAAVPAAEEAKSSEAAEEEAAAPAEEASSAAPAAEASSATDGAALSHTERLTHFYATHDPSKDVAKLATKYAGKEEKLYAAIAKKYGADAMAVSDAALLAKREAGEGGEDEASDDI